MSWVVPISRVVPIMWVRSLEFDSKSEGSKSVTLIWLSLKDKFNIYTFIYFLSRPSLKKEFMLSLKFYLLYSDLVSKITIANLSSKIIYNLKEFKKFKKKRD